MAVEVFGNVPVTTVTSGGTDAPASGTQQTWTVASSSLFPAVSSSATPPTQIHVADVALNTEVISVINISGTTWTVIRGAESTTPVAHSAGFTIYQVVSAGAYGQLFAVDWLNVVTQFGADPTGSADSTTAIGNAVAAAGSLQPVYFPAGTYKITSVLNWKIPGLTVLGDSSASVTIQQATANTPILQVAGTRQRISGLNLRWASQQTSGQTSAIAMEFGDDTVGSCFMSCFEDIYIELANTGMAVNPAIATVAGLFSCYFNNIEVLGYSVSALNFAANNGGGNANCTGCVFDNVYVHNNFTGSDASSTTYPISFNGWDEVVFNQLNVERAELFQSGAALFAHCGNVVLNSVHLEHLEMSGTPGFGLIGVGTGTNMVQVNGLSVKNSVLEGTSLNSAFLVTGGSNQNIILNGLNFPTTGNTLTAGALAIVDFNSATGVSAQVTGLDAIQSQLYTENIANAGAGSQMVITDGAQVTYSPPLGWTSFATGNSGNNLNATSGGASPPSTGTWYYAQMFVPFTFTATGLIAAIPSGENGTDKWIGAIWTPLGAVVTSSATAGTTTPAANENFKLPFSAATSLAGPATYLAGVQSNGTAAHIEVFNNNVEGFVTGFQAGTYGVIAAIGTPATTYTANTGPMLKTY